MAGLLGAGLVLILKPFMNPGYIFMLMTPFSFMYLINCIILVRKRARHPFIDETLLSHKKDYGSIPSQDPDEMKTEGSLIDENSEAKNSNIDIGDDAHENLPLNWTNGKNVMKKVWWYIANLFTIYLFQYL